jgi:3-oxoacyl-[acyl-carrier protein] reductase
LGPVEILVNNVGGSTDSTPVELLSAETWLRTMDANAKSAFLCTRAVVPGMKEQRWGRIVNVSSIAGRTRTHFTNAAYTAAKAAVIGFSRQCAAELAPFGITVNVVAPGVIATKRIEAVWAKKPEAEKKRLLGLVPAGRLGRPDEVARAIADLCDDRAGYTTGAVLDMTGGMFIG